MSLPRRIPWLPDEFAYVYASLFASDGNTEIQMHGVQRIRAWISRGCCPHAVESTATLLEALLLRNVSSHIMRNAFSMAVIRFVNGLVDPLQQSMHAQSIAKIALQLNLPQWFVELRHAATHQDLPSLPSLRQACEKALDWLYQRYWIPQMHFLSGTSSSPQQSLLHEQLYQEFKDQLRAFKIQRKEVVRDVSKFRARELMRQCQAIEKVLALIASEGGAAREESSGSAGIEILLDLLLDPGALVPTSVRKRCTPRKPQLSNELIEIWTPLLEHFDEQYPSFARLMAERMIDVLHAAPQDEPSYVDTLAAWLSVVVERFLTEQTLQESLIRYSLLNPNVYTLRLLQHMQKKSKTADLQTSIDNLLSLMQQQLQGVAGLTVPSDDQLDARFQALQERYDGLRDNLPAKAASQGTLEKSAPTTLAPGWKLVEVDGKAGMPIGALLPDVEFQHLLLPPRIL